MKKAKVFFLAGRTGGPLIPLIPVAKHLDSKYQILFFGYPNGFEVQYLQKHPWRLKFLPETKFNLATYKGLDWWSQLRQYYFFLGYVVNFFKALAIATFWLFRYRPKAIITAGSSLNIPFGLSLKIFKKLGILKTKLIVHQQDPKPGLSNKFLATEADLLTTTFDYTNSNYPTFAKAKTISNPLDINRLLTNQTKNSKLKNFLKQSKLPILLVYGGGSGSEAINLWVKDNQTEIVKNFSLIHLTGVLQYRSIKYPKNSQVLRLKSLDEDMGMALKTASIVVSRAGLGSITELKILSKPAVLIPLPNSHQELNAELVKTRFKILPQAQISQLLKLVLEISSKSSKKVSNQAQNFENYNSKYLKMIDELLA